MFADEAWIKEKSFANIFFRVVKKKTDFQTGTLIFKLFKQSNLNILVTEENITKFIDQDSKTNFSDG